MAKNDPLARVLIHGQNWSSRLAAVVLTQAVLLLIAPQAVAHDIYTSFAEAKFLPDKLELTLVLARSSAHDLLPNSRELSAITPDTFAEHAPRLRAIGRELFEISAAGKPLALSGPVVVRIGGDADVTFILQYPRPKYGPLKIVAQYLRQLIDGHVATTAITGPAGEDLGWAPLTVDQPVLTVPLPRADAKLSPKK